MYRGLQLQHNEYDASWRLFNEFEQMSLRQSSIAWYFILLMETVFCMRAVFISHPSIYTDSDRIWTEIQWAKLNHNCSPTDTGLHVFERILCVQGRYMLQILWICFHHSRNEGLNADCSRWSKWSNPFHLSLKSSNRIIPQNQISADW